MVWLRRVSPRSGTRVSLGLGIALALVLLVRMLAPAHTLSVGSASPLEGSLQCEATFPAPQSNYQAFDTTGDLAFSGNLAAPAVASGTLAGFPEILAAAFINDGHYGIGRSWVSNAANAWIKIDLGVEQTVSRIRFGRDRLGGFDDRDPGQFFVDYATSDAVYADGNDANDGTEYTKTVDSSTLGFSGVINADETVGVDLDPLITARYIKQTFASNGAAIDEVAVSAPALRVVDAALTASAAPVVLQNGGGTLFLEDSRLKGLGAREHVVPEPGVFLQLVSGFGLLMLLERRHRRRRG